MHIILFIQPLSNQPTSSLRKRRAGSFSGNTEPQLTSLALITNQVEFSLWPSIRPGPQPPSHQILISAPETAKQCQEGVPWQSCTIINTSKDHKCFQKKPRSHVESRVGHPTGMGHQPRSPELCSPGRNSLEGSALLLLPFVSWIPVHLPPGPSGTYF